MNCNKIINVLGYHDQWMLLGQPVIGPLLISETYTALYNAFILSLLKVSLKKISSST